MNLLHETIQIMAENGVAPQDVVWVGTVEQWSTWENFADVADTYYDNGFGGQEVAYDLMIVGTDWWMTRREYDGAERWDFNRYPNRPQRAATIKALTIDQANKLFDLDLGLVGWQPLAVINNECEEE